MLSMKQIVMGLVCPCMESPDDRFYRESVEYLQQGKLFKRQASKEGSKGSSLFSMFGGSSQKESTNIFKVYLSDSELVFEVQAEDESSNEVGQEDEKIWLKKVGEIKTKGSTKIKIIGNHPMRPGEVLCELDCVTTKEDRDDFFDALNVCLDAYKKNPYDLESSTTDSERSDDPTGLKARAQRATHFAKKEIEMKKRQQDREKIKAKYMKDSGGLKYTALAMANRS